MKIHYLGIDLAKNVFQLCGLSQAGKVIYSKRVRRPQLLQIVAQIEPCRIGIEACAGAYHWQRQFNSLGHDTKIISPQIVKPFISGQKNDTNDAKGIAIALSQPTTRFVPARDEHQQDIQALHRARSGLVSHRSASVSQIRGFLLERGISIGITIGRFRREIPQILEDAENGLSHSLRSTIAALLELIATLDQKISHFDREINQVFKTNELCQRISTVPGVGPKTATAIVAAVGNGSEFKNGRHFAAWLGLVPRQRSSGDKTRLAGISKRGDKSLRTLLVHGARAVVRVAKKKEDRLSCWVTELEDRRGYNKAAIAVANKNARIIWSLLHTGQSYSADFN